MIVGAAGIAAPALVKGAALSSTPKLIKDDISIAQWALVGEIQKACHTETSLPKS